MAATGRSSPPPTLCPGEGRGKPQGIGEEAGVNVPGLGFGVEDEVGTHAFPRHAGVCRYPENALRVINSGFRRDDGPRRQRQSRPRILKENIHRKRGGEQRGEHS